MKAQKRGWLIRLILTVLLPLAAFALQSLFWAAITPFAWFLFFPAVFLSSWIGGLPGGVVAMAISTVLAWWFFIPPEHSFALDETFTLGSIGLFVGMGVLFGYSNERIRKANRETAEALAAARTANDQLQDANERITQLFQKTLELDQLKSQFFANVSHELRTPLTLILGPVAKRLAAADLNDAERRDLEVVERSARLLYRHVADLLDVAKLESGGMEMRYAQVDLARLVRFVASHFDVLAGEKGIRYTVDAPGELPAQVDAEKCQRVLLNLLSNAFKFTPDGGAVEATVRATGGQAVIQVQDDGPGVPPTLRQAVFERFRQVEGGAERRFGGTGLGLAIVKEFVELHGGNVEAAETPERGALFTVTLPLAAPQGTEIQATPGHLDELLDRQALDELRTPRDAGGVAAPSAGDAPLIMVVEDNPDMNAFVAEALGPRYRVVTAFDGQEGLSKALALRPDLILSDVMMPRMSGDQMVQELRRHPEMENVPIVMLTAKADDSLAVKLLQQGAQDYLHKPFSVEELLARVGGLVTERRQAARRLSESEARWQFALEGSDQGVWDWNVPEGTMFFSTRWKTMLGYAEDDITESLGGWSGRVHPDDLPAVLEDVRRNLHGETAFYQNEHRVLRKDGSYCWVLDRGKMIERTPDGQPRRMIGTYTDISARKAAEQALRDSQAQLLRLNEELEQRVTERTAQLQAANQELEAFTYSVSHDLRAPLRGIDGFSKALLEDCAAQLDDQGRHYLERVRTASQRMGRLIDDLLRLSRVSRTELHRLSVDLSVMAGEIAARMQESAPDRNMEAVVAPGVRAHADPRLMHIVLENLIGNAWKFTGRRADARIEFGCGPADGETVFWVRDNGAGFDMRYADKLFGAFQRLHPVDEFEGTGIGLSIVQRIVRRHGGHIWAEAVEGEGATFYFTIPSITRAGTEMA